MKHIAFLGLWTLLIVTNPRLVSAAPSDLVLPKDPGWHNADVMQKAGIVMGDPGDDYIGRRHFTRRDFAAAIARLTAQAGFRSVIELENRLLESPPAIEALNSLVDEFAPELTSLRQNVTAERAWLASLQANVRVPLAAKPFADVPLSHWASASVESLRLHRIVVGYGNENFNVSR